MSDELRHRLENAGRDPVTPLRLDFVEKRARRLTLQTLAVAMFSLAVLIAGAFGVRSVISTDAAPLPPAERGDSLPGPMRNGRIVHSQANVSWQVGSPVPRPGATPYYAWQAFDQETGSFLYVGGDDRLLHVIDQDGLVAEVPCDTATTTANDLVTWATACEYWARFGPGPDEVSVPSNDLVDHSVEEPDTRFVQTMAFDGTIRDKLDVLAVVTQGQWLTDFAWSRDGSHLAISTEPDYDCDPTTSRCEANVWIIDRAGGEPQLVFTERTPEDLVEGKYINHPSLGQLAWSPDGRTLSLLLKYTFQEPGEPVRPRLVALRLRPNQTTHADTLHVYGRTEWERGESRRQFQYFITEAVAYAWSPDGTRIAISSPSQIAEISADDGTVLTRHPAKEFPVLNRTGEDFLGLLAWLREQ